MLAGLLVAPLSAALLLAASFVPWFRFTYESEFERDEATFSLWETMSAADIVVAIAVASIVTLVPVIAALGRRATLSVLLLAATGLLISLSTASLESILIGSNESFHAYVADELKDEGLDGSLAIEGRLGPILALAGCLAALIAALYVVVADARGPQVPRPGRPLVARLGFGALLAATLLAPAAALLPDGGGSGWETSTATGALAAAIVAGALLCALAGLVVPRSTVVAAASCGLAATIAGIALTWSLERLSSEATADALVTLVVVTPAAAVALVLIAVGAYPRPHRPGVPTAGSP